MVAQVRYSVAGRSRGRVAPCTVCTGHVETRNTGFLVEPQNQGRRGGPEATLGWAAGARAVGHVAAPSWAAGAGAAGHMAAPELPRAGQRELEPQDTWWPRRVPSGFRQFGLKTGGDGFSRFVLKTGGRVFWLSLKTKVTRVFWFGPQNWQL
jgi:hypothetical protein